MIFGLFGIAGTYAGALLGVVTPVVIQLALFALVMYAAAWKMLKPKPTQHRSVGAMAVADCPDATVMILSISTSLSTALL